MALIYHNTNNNKTASWEPIMLKQKSIICNRVESVGDAERERERVRERWNGYSYSKQMQ